MQISFVASEGVPFSKTGGLADVVSSPIYATGVGLVKYGVKFSSPNQIGDENVYSKVKKRMLHWLGEIF